MRRMTQQVARRLGERWCAQRAFKTAEVPTAEGRVTVFETPAKAITMSWPDGGSSRFYAPWLRLSCPTCYFSTGQRVVTPADPQADPDTCTITRVVENGETVVITYSDGHESTLPTTWLMRHRHDLEVFKHDDAVRDPLQDTHRQPPRVSWSEMLRGDEGVWKCVMGVHDAGLCIVDDVPTTEGTVLEVATSIGPIMPTLYVTPFDVKSEINPINIAYTGHKLIQHMDLPYYEAPPGLQLLHCLKFSENVTGGESTFVDGHAAAEELRRVDPEAFDVLTRVPATFQKDHLKRANPAQFFYQRPHIKCTSSGSVSAVFWSPPFEGTLRVPEEDVVPYYRAYRKFASIIESLETRQKWGYCFRLKPGQLVVFNNRRMLHGREAFELHGTGERHLQGCYISSDDFSSRYRNLALKFAPSSPADYLAALGGSMRRIGNSDSR